VGFTSVRVQVCNPAEPERRRELELLVDTGAMLSIIPALVLEELGIQRIATRRFRGFDGRGVQRQIGAATFRYGGQTAGASVVFGEPGDVTLLGVTAQEALGYQVDPVTGRLRRVELLMVTPFPVPERRRGSRR
jgi:predicted aspartyl protease